MFNEGLNFSLSLAGPGISPAKKLLFQSIRFDQITYFGDTIGSDSGGPLIYAKDDKQQMVGMHLCKFDELSKKKELKGGILFNRKVISRIN